MFSAPAAPEPIATASKEKKPVRKDTFTGATNRPTTAVNRTRDITLGFMRSKKDFK